MFRINSNISKSSDSVSNNGDINNILLVGNGFDLALGLNTSYSDFVKFLAIKIYLSKITDVLKSNSIYRDWVKKCLIDENNELGIKVCSFSKKIIEQLNDIDKNFIFYSKETEDRGIVTLAVNPFFNDFFKVVIGKVLHSILIECHNGSLKSSGILNYSDRFFEIESSFQNSFSTNFDPKAVSEKEIFIAKHNIYGFIKLLNENLEKATVKQWVDVESFIEFLVTNDRDLSIRFSPEEKDYYSPLFANPALYKKYFNGIDEFSDLFDSYLKMILPNSFVNFGLIRDSKCSDFDNLIANITLPYNNSLNNRSHGYLEIKNFANPSINVDIIINYNYTYATEAYFLSFIKKDLIDHTYHINGEVDYNTHFKISFDNKNNNHLVFGFTKPNSIKLKSTLHTFEKKVLRVIKNTTPLDLKKLTSNPFNLLIYGHSCGIADGDVIGELLKSPNLKLAVVLCYDQDSLVSITNNLIEIVEQDRFDELLNNANQKLGNKSLYFAVRDEFS